MFDQIKTVAELNILAQADQSIYDLLADTNLGRRAAALDITMKGFPVTDKLVRTWREKNLAGSDADVTPMDMVSSYVDMRNPFEYRPQPKTIHTTGTSAVPTVSVKQGKAPKTKTIVVMPDLQAPLHDVELVEKFIDFLSDFGPSELAQTGDFTDSTEISRWVRGKKEEYAGDLQGGFDASMDVLDGIREVFDGRFRIVRSNHDDRLENYIYTCAPGLNLRDITFEKQLHLDEYEVEFVRDGMVELFDDWIMGHGDEGSMSPQAGKTAFGLAKNKFGVNVVCGHTHRAGITSESYGYNGKLTRQLVGLEVGHFMDMRQAHYLAKKGGVANWQQAFGILEQVNGKVFPHLIPVIDGNFSVDGVAY